MRPISFRRKVAAAAEVCHRKREQANGNSFRQFGWSNSAHDHDLGRADGPQENYKGNFYDSTEMRTAQRESVRALATFADAASRNLRRRRIDPMFKSGNEPHAETSRRYSITGRRASRASEIAPEDLSIWTRSRRSAKRAKATTSSAFQSCGI